MADNVSITPGSGITVATDDVGAGVQVQRVKATWGVDGTATDTSASNPLPTSGVGTVAHDAVGTSVNPLLFGGYASAAAPTDVSADGDAVRAWLLRNGAAVAALSAGGALIGGDATNGLDVDVTRVKPDGTNVMPSMDSIARAGFQKITDGSNTLTLSSAGAAFVTGGTAHDAVDAGNPVKIGYKAIAYGANPTAVAAADRSDAYCNRAGILFTLGGHPNVITLEAAYTGAQTDTAIVTISTGLKIVVTQIQLITDNANTAFPQVRVGFGTANTPTTTGVVLTHPGAAAGGGISRGDGSGTLGVGADNEDLRITCGAPTGGSLRILVTYFTVES